MGFLDNFGIVLLNVDVSTLWESFSRRYPFDPNFYFDLDGIPRVGTPPLI